MTRDDAVADADLQMIRRQHEVLRSLLGMLVMRLGYVPDRDVRAALTRVRHASADGHRVSIGALLLESYRKAAVGVG